MVNWIERQLDEIDVHYKAYSTYKFNSIYPILITDRNNKVFDWNKKPSPTLELLNSQKKQLVNKKFDRKL